jgi:hypothetical protein
VCLLVVNLQIHRKLRKETRRLTRVHTEAAGRLASHGKVIVDTDVSGMSVVEPSCYSVGGRRSTRPTGGLFSDVESEDVT